jgi:hypothetical protein
MPRKFLEKATRALALEESALMQDRASVMPRVYRTSQYWANVDTDPDGDVSCVVIEEGREGPMDAGQLSASTEDVTTLSTPIQSWRMVLDIYDWVTWASANNIVALFDEMKQNQRAELKRKLVEDPQLEADFFANMAPGQENKLRDELGPPL